MAWLWIHTGNQRHFQTVGFVDLCSLLSFAAPVLELQSTARVCPLASVTQSAAERRKGGIFMYATDVDTQGLKSRSRDRREL